MIPLASALDSFTGAIDFIFNERPSVEGSTQVGGPSEVGDYLLTHVELSAAALLVSLVIALPFGIYLGHRGRGELFAVALGNAGRAIPELVLIAFLIAFVGTGFLNLTIALAVLGIPPILTNTFVGIRQADRDAVAAARGVGMTEPRIATRVELPLAAPTIMGGVRTAAINIIATATIAPLAGTVTLGDFILNQNVYGVEGVIAGAIVVAALVVFVEGCLALLQRALTPEGIRVQRVAARAG